MKLMGEYYKKYLDVFCEFTAEEAGKTIGMFVRKVYKVGC